MEQKQKSKQSLGTKLSERDVQFTSAIRKAEVRNVNEIKNMKKSIEQLSKEHQQILNNLKRERSHLVRRWNLRKQESALIAVSDAQKDDPVESENVEADVVKEKESEIRLPYIKVPDRDQKSTLINYHMYDSARNLTRDKVLKQDKDGSDHLPPSIDRRSNERNNNFSSNELGIERAIDRNDERSAREKKFSKTLPPFADRIPSNRVRKVTAAPFNSPKLLLPSKRALSLSLESGLSHLVRAQKKFQKNLSVEAFHDSSFGRKLRRNESREEGAESFFKTEL